MLRRTFLRNLARLVKEKLLTKERWKNRFLLSLNPKIIALAIADKLVRGVSITGLTDTCQQPVLTDTPLVSITGLTDTPLVSITGLTDTHKKFLEVFKNNYRIFSSMLAESVPESLAKRHNFRRLLDEHERFLFQTCVGLYTEIMNLNLTDKELKYLLHPDHIHITQIFIRSHLPLDGLPDRLHNALSNDDYSTRTVLLRQCFEALCEWNVFETKAIETVFLNPTESWRIINENWGQIRTGQKLVSLLSKVQ